MSLFTALLPQADEIPFDDKGYTTIDPILPPTGELIIGSLASLLVFGMLYKFAWPVIKKAMQARTARIQAQLDESAAARAAAEEEAIRIRKAKGDIDAERSRLYAEADAQAEALLVDGRARLEEEITDLEARADADIAAAAARGGDELRVEIARYSSAAIERVVDGTLDDAAHQDLIERFISRVGAS